MDKKKAEQAAKLIKDRNRLFTLASMIEGLAEKDDLVLTIEKVHPELLKSNQIHVKEFPFMLDAVKRCYYDAMARHSAIEGEIAAL